MDCSTPGSPSITNSQSLLKLMPIDFVMPSNHLIHACLPAGSPRAGLRTCDRSPRVCTVPDSLRPGKGLKAQGPQALAVSPFWKDSAGTITALVPRVRGAPAWVRARGAGFAACCPRPVWAAACFIDQVLLERRCALSCRDRLRLFSHRRLVVEQTDGSQSLKCAPTSCSNCDSWSTASSPLPPEKDKEQTLVRIDHSFFSHVQQRPCTY